MYSINYVNYVLDKLFQFQGVTVVKKSQCTINMAVTNVTFPTFVLLKISGTMDYKGHGSDPVMVLRQRYSNFSDR